LLHNLRAAVLREFCVQQAVWILAKTGFQESEVTCITPARAAQGEVQEQTQSGWQIEQGIVLGGDPARCFATGWEQ